MYAVDNLIFKGGKSLGGLQDHIAADLADISLFPACSSCVPAGCDNATPPVEALADPVISLYSHTRLSIGSVLRM